MLSFPSRWRCFRHSGRLSTNFARWSGEGYSTQDRSHSHMSSQQLQLCYAISIVWKGILFTTISLPLWITQMSTERLTLPSSFWTTSGEKQCGTTPVTRATVRFALWHSGEPETKCHCWRTPRMVGCTVVDKRMNRLSTFDIVCVCECVCTRARVYLC